MYDVNAMIDAGAKGAIGGAALGAIGFLIFCYGAAWAWLKQDENRGLRKITKVYLIVSAVAILFYGLGLAMLLVWPLFPLSIVALKKIFAWVGE